jgi:hypothetical protein
MLLIEPKGTVNTGASGGELTTTELEREASVPLPPWEYAAQSPTYAAAYVGL